MEVNREYLPNQKKRENKIEPKKKKRKKIKKKEYGIWYLLSRQKRKTKNASRTCALSTNKIIINSNNNKNIKVEIGVFDSETLIFG